MTTTQRAEIIFAVKGTAAQDLAKIGQSGKTAGEDLKKGGAAAELGMKGLNIAGLGAAAAVGALALGLKSAIKSAMEAEMVMAQTENTIRATGGAAGLTAQQVADMAGSLSLLTGIEDDTILSGQNLLLTFKAIGADTFPRATAAMADLAVMMNKGSVEGLNLQTTSMMLGKALQDPTKGITALQRAGISFSDSQKAMIREMVATNDLAGAQALILAELEAQVGGAAEAAGKTAAGSFAKLKNVVGELGEEIGKELLPPLTAAATFMTLLLTENELAEASFDGLRKKVDATAQTYDAYVQQMIDIAVASGKLNSSEAEHIRLVQRGERTHETQIFHAQEYLERLNLLTPAQQRFGIAAHAAGFQVLANMHAQEQAAQASKAYSDRLQGLADDLGIVGEANFELKKTVDNTEESFRRLKVLLDGDLGQANANYYQQQKDLGGEIVATKEKLQELIDQGYSPTSDAVLDQQTRLGELQDQYTANADAHDVATKRILFNMLTQQFAADGLSQAEGQALAGIAEEWGLLDHDTAMALRGMQGSIAAFNNSGDWRQFISDITGLPAVKNIDIHVRTHYESYGAEPGPPAPVSVPPGPDVIGPGDYKPPVGPPGENTNFAHGANFIVPPGYPNDSFRMGVQSGEHVMVTPANQAHNYGRSGGPIIGQLHIHAAPGMDEERLAELASRKLAAELRRVRANGTGSIGLGVR